ncbi:hypothetical protein B0H13DRAFT_1889897 [Mycena leptocephala]|nr:hypothetical protein B0H13DRAFT_1889897 [Mycena leptocephala]
MHSKNGSKRKKESISEADEAWLDNEVNHVEEDTVIDSLENTSDYKHHLEYHGEQSPKTGQVCPQPLLLDEKVQLVEMHQLGVFTKEEFLSCLEQIEAHYEEVATRPTPAKWPRLSN